MGVLSAFFGCRGVVGFNACCSGASSGDGGFTLACISGCRGVIGCIVATWLCPVREKVRPAWPDGGCEREKVRPASPKRPKNAVFRRVGRTFSRKCRWRGRAGRTFSRKSPWRPAAGWSFSWASSRGVPLGACVAPRCRARAAPDLGCATDPRSRAQDLGCASRRGCPKEPQVGDTRAPFRRIPAVSPKSASTPTSRGD